MDLNSAALFVKVVQYGSFSETARQTNTPVATISRRIADLEKELGVRLLERSTRHLRMTQAGAAFYEDAARGLEAFEMGLSTLENQQQELTGTLRLSLPPAFLPWQQLLQDFQVRYHQVKFDIFITERRVNLIEDGIDVALRIGDRKDNQAIVKKLGEYRHQLVASPDFLEQYGTPSQREQLLTMPCASWHAQTTWLLGNESIQISPIFQVNDYLHLLKLALAGSCVTELPPFLIQEHLMNGRLKTLLKDYPLPAQQLNLLYPSRKQLSRLVRTYIDFCAEWVDGLFQ
ncbi:LysR family transcriptional regulator [Pseudanabaena sp. PCC 6802]|uniref:LysR family transcriptional regulator n=1 Tax=Pseudanabaena sp. PCC 6802 TaxID=118173 RepID=UPI00034C891E|nr:LysR family transcriptional regulator [Pseudanabaena sp. PCC 6802]